MEKIETTLIFARNCKHSVIFKPVEKTDAFSSVYVLTNAIDKLNNPKKIKITIEAVN